jgi:hypothetical protein
MVTLVITAEGPNADQATAVAADFFKREFKVEAESQILSSREAEKSFPIEPGWIGVALAIPGAISASIQLNERLKLIERTSAMLDEMRRHLGHAGGVIRVGTVKALDIATVKAKDLVDAILSVKE